MTVVYTADALIDICKALRNTRILLVLGACISQEMYFYLDGVIKRT